MKPQPLFPPARPNVRQAFTFVELLAAISIMVVILLVIFGLIQQTATAWKGTSSRIEAFQGARAALDQISHALGQATLNSYYDYQYDETGMPNRYIRKSDLHFVSGKSLIPNQVSHAVFFQTPEGYSNVDEFQTMDTLLNAIGFYVVFDTDHSRPEFLDTLRTTKSNDYRFRLMEFVQPSQELMVYEGNPDPKSWFLDPLSSGQVIPRQVASNILAMVIRPMRSTQETGDPLAPQFDYDSRSGGSTGPQPAVQHQLPPLVELILIAIDEASATRLANGSTPPDFGISARFQEETALDDDIYAVEKRLNEKKAAYRVFRMMIALRNGKWSS